MAEGAEAYRTKALEMMARAKAQPGPKLRSELEELSFAYLRLAEHADRFGATVHEG